MNKPYATYELEVQVFELEALRCFLDLQEQCMQLCWNYDRTKYDNHFFSCVEYLSI